MIQNDNKFPGYESSDQGLELINISELLHSILRRLWIVLLSFVLIMGAVVVYVIMAPRLYVSTAVLQVNPSGPNVLNVGEVVSDDYRSAEQMKTAEENLQRISQLERVAMRDELFYNDKFVKPELRKQEGIATSLAYEIKKATKVNLKKGTRLIEVSVEHRDAEVAATLANAIVGEFMMELIQTRSGTSRDAYDFLVAEEKRLKAKLEQSEQALPDFKDITEIKQRIIDQEKEVSTLRQRYRDKHPKLIQALTLLNDSRQEYLSALSTKIPVPAEVKAPRPGETSEERINRILSENEIRYNQLAREVETNKAIYDSVVKRLKETDVSKGVQQINMRISEKAVASGSPSKPKVLLVLALGVFGSLLFGIGIVLGINALDSSLKTVDETERYLGVPVLGAIPEARKDIDKTKIRSKKHLKNSVRDEIQDQIQAKADELQDKIEESGPEWARQGVNRVRTRTRQTREVEPLVMLNQGYSNSAEAFRSLRASFSLLKRDGEPRTFLFTSAVPSEGKSFTSANSAVAFAQTGQKVLLIDADLRRPTQQNLFNRSINDHGLTNALASGRSYKEFIFESSQENLNLLMAGHRAPNPAELLAGGAFERIIKEALQDYDRIVIDSAPINAVSDTIYLLDHVDIVSLVVRAGTTPRRAVARATESLRKAGRKLSGVVLNRLPTRSGFGYDPYFYYYSASDGYGEAYGSSQGS